jgi:hypothetical protein
MSHTTKLILTAQGQSAQATPLKPIAIVPPVNDTRTLELCFDGTGDQVDVCQLVDPCRHRWIPGQQERGL